MKNKTTLIMMCLCMTMLIGCRTETTGTEPVTMEPFITKNTIVSGVTGENFITAEIYKEYSSFSKEEDGGLERLDTEADYEPQYIETMEYCKEEEAVLLTDYKQYLEKWGGCTDELFYPKELFDTHNLYYIKKSVNGGGAYYTVDEISYSDSEEEIVANVALTYHVNMIDTDVMGTRYIFIPINKDVAKLFFDEEVTIHE